MIKLAFYSASFRWVTVSPKPPTFISRFPLCGDSQLQKDKNRLLTVYTVDTMFRDSRISGQASPACAITWYSWHGIGLHRIWAASDGLPSSCVNSHDSACHRATTHPWLWNVSYSSFDVRKGDSYTGRGMVVAWAWTVLAKTNCAELWCCLILKFIDILRWYRSQRAYTFSSSYYILRES